MFRVMFLWFRHTHTACISRGGEWSIQIAAKFYLCSICSQNLNECSLARAPKMFAVAGNLAFLSVLLEIS